MLQAALQPGLLLRRKLPELRIIFEGAALLCRRHILIVAKPVSGVAGAVLRRMGLIRAVGDGTTFVLKMVPLPVRGLRLPVRLRLGLRIAGLGEGGLDEQGT
jgi:hypothetical protein